MWIAPVKPQGANLRGLALDHSTIDAYEFLIYRVTLRGNPVKTVVRNPRNPGKVWAGGVRPLPRIPAATYKTNLVPTRFQMRGGVGEGERDFDATEVRAFGAHGVVMPARRWQGEKARTLGSDGVQSGDGFMTSSRCLFTGNATYRDLREHADNSPGLESLRES